MPKKTEALPMPPNEVANWKVWERQTAVTFVQALIQAHGGEQGDVNWYAARACAFTDALRKELLADRAPVTDIEPGERKAVSAGQLPLFTDKS